MSTSKDQEVIAERGKTYGDAFQCHTSIGQVWAGILGNWQGVHVDDIPADVVALMLAAMKLVRSTRVYHEDNYIDARNYVNFAEQFKKPEEISIHKYQGVNVDTAVGGFYSFCSCGWKSDRMMIMQDAQIEFEKHAND